MKKLVSSLGVWVLLICGFLLLTGLDRDGGQRSAEAAEMRAQASSTAVLASTNVMTPTVYLPVIFGPAEPSTSNELIDAAVAGNEIDPEAALVYKVYAAFDDDRLPARFRGNDSEVVDNQILAVVQAEWDTLSATTQNLLRPFLIPPVYEGSWLYLRRTGKEPPALPQGTPPLCNNLDMAAWSYRDADVPVRIWWPTEAVALSDKADILIAAMDYAIWPKLTGLMRSPLSDAEADCNGGDGRLDVYLVPIDRSNAPALEPPGCKKTPAYINLGQEESVDILAHEFMHTIQWGYDTAVDCMYPGDYAWLAEATAQWAEDYVYPTNNAEHYTSKWFLNKPLLPLDTKNDRHEYGAYLFFQYLARQYSPGLISIVWDQTETHDSLAAINAALSDGGGLQHYWPEFTLWAWNRAPVDHLKQWDQLEGGARTANMMLLLLGVQAAEYALPTDIPHLASRYYYMEIADSNLHSLVFWNPFYSQSPRDPTVSVKALFRVSGGDWVQEDWTNLYSRHFCRDLRDERVAEMLIVISNSAWEDRDHVVQSFTPPHVTGTNISCWRWTGTSTGVAHQRDPFIGRDIVDTYTAHITWERDPSTSPTSPGAANTWHIVPGLSYFDWTRSGMWSTNCSVEGQETGIPLTAANGWMWLYYDYSYKPYSLGRHILNGQYAPQLTHKETCPDSTTTRSWSNGWVFTSKDGLYYVSADGQTMKGTYDYGDGAQHYTWEFAPVDPQP
jgi:hypothetical protein